MIVPIGRGAWIQPLPDAGHESQPQTKHLRQSNPCATTKQAEKFESFLVTDEECVAKKQMSLVVQEGFGRLSLETSDDFDVTEAETGELLYKCV